MNEALILAVLGNLHISKDVYAYIHYAWFDKHIYNITLKYSRHYITMLTIL